MIMSISVMKKLFRKLKFDKLFKKKKLVLAISAITIIAVSFVAYNIIVNKIISYNSAKIYEVSEAKNKIYTQADSVAVKDGAAAGQSELDKNLASAKTDSDKAYIYCAKASLAASITGGKKYDEALVYANKAEILKPTAATAALIAGLQANKQDKERAIKYYQLAIDRLSDSSSAMDKADINYYKKLIEELKK